MLRTKAIWLVALASISATAIPTVAHGTDPQTDAPPPGSVGTVAVTEGTGPDVPVTGHADATDRIVVTYGPAESTSPERVEAVLSERVGVPLRVSGSLGDGSLVMQLPGPRPFSEVEALAARISATAGVTAAAPDAIFHPATVPTDPRYGHQWHLRWSTPNDWGSNLEPAWSISTGGPVTVAVIDTGRRDHVDLTGRLLDGVDMISQPERARDGNGRDNNETDTGDHVPAGLCGSGAPASNSSWHGTLVAGVLAANANNGTGGAGVSWGARVLHVRALGRCGGLSSDIADAIRWAAGQSIPGVAANATPAKIINLSVGGPGTCAPHTQSAIDYAVAQGAIVVVAAGNAAQALTNYQPANCLNVVVVAAGNRQGHRASYSNFGFQVDITAPGGELTSGGVDGVLTTANAGTTSPGADNAYRFVMGTSLAAPQVSGVLALMKSVQPTATATELTDLLLDNTRPFRSGTWCATQTVFQCGVGWLDAGRVLQAMTGATNPSLAISDAAVLERDSGTRTLTFRLTLSSPATRVSSLVLSTTNQSAVAPGDYTARSGTVTFAVGEQTKTFGITIRGDTVVEPDEYFTLHVSSPVNMTLPDPYGVGTIRNDD